MAFLSFVLILAARAAAFTQDVYKVGGGDALTLPHSAMDSHGLSLLQSAMLTEKAHTDMVHVFPETIVDSSKAYKSVAESCLSTSCGSPHMRAEMATNTAVTQRASTGPNLSDATLQDPPHAGTFKALLRLMILCIVVHGTRKWRQQKAEAALQKEAAEALQDQEDVVDRAWEDMVKAAAGGDVTSFKKALSHKPSLEREDLWGCRPLHFAAKGGSLEITTELLDVGAEVNAADTFGETSLHFAARSGHVDVCELLLARGANINALSEHGMTPLVVSGQASHELVCRMLADHGGSAGGMADEVLPLVVVSQVLRRVFDCE
jgi:hypothetical protein